MPNSFETPWAISSRLLCSLDFLGKNTGVGCHLLLHRPSQPRDWTYIAALQADSLPLSHQGNQQQQNNSNYGDIFFQFLECSQNFLACSFCIVYCPKWCLAIVDSLVSSSRTFWSKFHYHQVLSHENTSFCWFLVNVTPHPPKWSPANWWSHTCLGHHYIAWVRQAVQRTDWSKGMKNELNW